MSREDDRSNVGLDEALKSTRAGIERFRDAMWHATRAVQHWIQRRSLGVRLVTLAVLGWISSEVFGVVWKATLEIGGSATSFLLESNVSPNAEQLIVVVLGVMVGNAWHKARKLNTIEHKIDDMDSSPDATTDGGVKEDSRRLGDTSGGGAVGGLIAGGALGSSFGPQGAVIGAFVGAALGDTIEQKADRLR